MPKNNKVDNDKPKNYTVTGEQTTYTTTRVIAAGQWIPLAGLTYPTAGTFTATRI